MTFLLSISMSVMLSRSRTPLGSVMFLILSIVAAIFLSRPAMTTPACGMFWTLGVLPLLRTGVDE